jgi:hypothetical protein
MDESLTVMLDPFRTVSESNQREHWSVKHRRTKMQRSTVFYWLRHWLGVRCPVTLPMTITITRVAPRALDSGNLENAMKSIQDGIADYLSGTYLGGQDRQQGLIWRYAQRRGGVGRYGLEICLKPGADEEHPSATATVIACDIDTASASPSVPNAGE